MTNSKLQFVIPFMMTLLSVSAMAFAQSTPGDSEDEIKAPKSTKLLLA